MPQHHLCVSRFLEAIDGDILNGARAWGNWVTTVNRIPDPIDRVRQLGDHRLRTLASLLIFSRDHGPYSAKTLSSLNEPHAIISSNRCRFKDAISMLHDVKIASLAVVRKNDAFATRGIVDLVNDRYLGVVAQSSIICSKSTPACEKIERWERVMMQLSKRSEEIFVMNSGVNFLSGIAPFRNLPLDITLTSMHQFKNQMSPPLIVCSAMVGAFLQLEGKSVADLSFLRKYLKETLHVPAIRIEASLCIALSCTGYFEDASAIALHSLWANDVDLLPSPLDLHWNLGFRRSPYLDGSRYLSAGSKKDLNLSVDERRLALEVLCRCLGRKGKGSTAADVIKTLLSHHSLLDKNLVSKVIDSDVHEAVILALIRSTNISLDSSTQRFHKSPLQAAEDYLSFVEIQSQNGKNYRPSRTILQKFVEGYARLGDLSSAERWHRYMQSIGLNLDAWGFRALSDAMMKSAVRGWRFGESDGSEASSKPVPPLPSSAHIPPTVSVNMNAASGSNGEDAVASLTLRAPLGPSDVCDYILSSAKQVGLGPPFPAPIVSILAKGLFSVGDIGRALELCKLSNSSIRWIILPNAHDKAPKYLKREVEKLLDYDFHLATVLLEGLFANRFTKVANVVATIIVKRKTSPVVDNILSKQRSITAQRLSANVNSVNSDHKCMTHLRGLLSKNRLQEAMNFYSSLQPINQAKFFVQEGTLGLGGWSLEVAALHYRMTGVVVRALAKRGLLRQAIDILTTSLRLDPSHQESIEERFHRLTIRRLCTLITPVVKGFSTKGDLSSGLNVFRHALVLALRSSLARPDYLISSCILAISDARLMMALYQGYFSVSMEMLAATRQHDQAGRIDPIAIWRQPKISSKYSNGIHFTSFVAAPAKECDSVAPKQDTIVSSTGVLPLFDNETFAGAYVSSRRKDVSPRERFLSDLTSCLNGVFESVGKTHAGWAKDKDFPTFLRIVSRKLMRDADAGCILFHALQDQEDAAGICFADAVSGSPNGTLDIDPKALVELQRMYLRLNRSESASAIASELAKYRLQSMELFGPTAVVEELAIRSCEDQAGFRPHRVLLPFDRLKEGGRLADSGYNIM